MTTAVAERPIPADYAPVIVDEGSNRVFHGVATVGEGLATVTKVTSTFGYAKSDDAANTRNEADLKTFIWHTSELIRLGNLDTLETDRKAFANQPGHTATIVIGKAAGSAVVENPKNDVDERKREISLLEPTRAVLTISRDGVSVVGDIHPQTGEGTEALREQLAHKLEQQRAPAGRPVVIRTTSAADLLGARRAAAAQMGHNIVETPGSHSLRCKNCGKPETMCLDGQPCVTMPVADTVNDEMRLRA